MAVVQAGLAPSVSYMREHFTMDDLIEAHEVINADASADSELREAARE